MTPDHDVASVAVPHRAAAHATSSEDLSGASDVRLSEDLEKEIRLSCAERLGRTPTTNEVAHYREFLVRITLIVQAITRRRTRSPSPSPEWHALPSTPENPRIPTISKQRASKNSSRGLARNAWNRESVTLRST